MDRIPLPWRALEQAIGGGLPPGLHAIAGPIGSGKTQFALQIANHVIDQQAKRAGLADRQHRVTVFAPSLDRAELGARIAGIRTRVHWGELHDRPPTIPDAISLQSDLEGTLAIVDHPLDDLSRLVAQARQIPILWVLRPSNPDAVKGFVPPEIQRRAPSEIAAWIGIDPAIASEVDGIWVLAPDRPRADRDFMTVEIAIAKNRRAIPARIALRFNGGWFEDEPQEIELGI